MLQPVVNIVLAELILFLCDWCWHRIQSTYFSMLALSWHFLSHRASVCYIEQKIQWTIFLQPHTSPEEGQSFLVNKDCWICYDSEKGEPLIQPCKCTGDVSSVHHECLRRWLVESCSKSDEMLKCKVCDSPYEVERTNK